MRFLTLRYFNEVAKLGSIRKAADRLHVAPSAISRQIAQLEHEVDAVLFERSKVGLQLTSAGELLARRSHGIFRDLARAQAEIDDLRGLRRGEVSVWVIEGFISGLLPDILANFHHRYPAVTFNVQTGSTDRIVEALLGDEADIGITFNATPRAEIEIIAEFVEPVSCLVAPTHEYADRKFLTLEDICKQSLALPEHSFGLRQVFERAVAARRLNPHVLVTTNSLELTKAMAAEYLAANLTDKNRGAIAKSLGVNNGPNLASRLSAAIGDMAKKRGASSIAMPLTAAIAGYAATPDRAEAADGGPLAARSEALTNAGLAGGTAVGASKLAQALGPMAGKALTAAGPAMAAYDNASEAQGYRGAMPPEMQDSPVGQLLPHAMPLAMRGAQDIASISRAPGRLRDALSQAMNAGPEQGGSTMMGFEPPQEAPPPRPAPQPMMRASALEVPSDIPPNAAADAEMEARFNPGIENRLKRMIALGAPPEAVASFLNQAVR